MLSSGLGTSWFTKLHPGGGLEKVHQLLSDLIFIAAFYPGVTVNQFANLSSAIVLT